MPYRIDFSRRALRELGALPRGLQLRIGRQIESLAVNPRPPGVRKLAGENDAYRIRIGDYRVVYEIHDRALVIVVIRVAHRREVYRS